LTEHASTFTRPDVLVALGAGLAGAGRADLEALADRFVAERAVSVVADRTLEERRWSTLDLLAVEHRLVASASGRTDERGGGRGYHLQFRLPRGITSTLKLNNRTLVFPDTR
jgi:hypothetical protein